MLSPIKRKIKKKSKARKNKNVKRVISVMRGLRQPKMVKSKLGRKISITEARSKHLKKRKNTGKQTYCRNIEESSVLQKTRDLTSERNQSLNLYKKNLTEDNARNKINTRLLSNKTSEKESLFNTIFKHSEEFNKSSSSNPIFIRLSDTDEKNRYINKFKKPASGRKLKRLREKLWKKSSYHQRFLEKDKITKSEKTQKDEKKVVQSNKLRLSFRKKDLNSKKSGVKSSVNVIDFIGKKNTEENIIQNKPSNHDLDIKKEVKENLEIRPLDTIKPLNEDISTVDESYLKSLLLIANSNIKSKTKEMKNQGKTCSDSGTETKNMPKMTGKEFFVSKMKNKKAGHGFISKNMENKTGFPLSSQLNGMKYSQEPPEEKNNSTSILQNAAKSETEIKLWKRGTTDIKNKEIKPTQKKAYSKHDIHNYQQKKKTRNIVKNKKENNIEVPFPCEVLKTKELQELWKRENSGIIQSCDSSSTVAENVNDRNVKGLGMESYQILKKYVEEEVHRISQKYYQPAAREQNRNSQQELGKEQKATSNEKQLSNLVRKKLAANSMEAFSQGEKKLENPETLNFLNLLQGGKPKKTKSKLKLFEEKKSQIRKFPDEIIKNWTIVNRLEQAFLALGTPDFRKIKQKEPGPANAKGTPTTERKVVEKKKIERKIKDAEKNEKKPATQVAANKQKGTELNKVCVNEKQLSVLHKKEPTTISRKPNTPKSASSTKSSKVDRKTKAREEKAPPQLRRPCKPSIIPTAKPVNLSVVKPLTPAENNRSLRKEFLSSRQIGKLGKKKSSRNLSRETSLQNINEDDNLERKKTFHIISLKDCVLMQPRRSKSCDKIDRSSAVERTNNFSSLGIRKCKKLTSTNENEQNQEFSKYLAKTENIKADEDIQETEMKTDQKDTLQALENSNKTKTKSMDQIFERPRNISKERVIDTSSNKPNVEKNCDKAVPLELPENALMMKETNHGSKARAIKERSILSIRTNQHENQTSRTNISQIQEECTPIIFQIDSLDQPKTNIRKDAKEVEVFLGATDTNYSETSCTSTGTYDLSELESNVEIRAQITTNDNEVELLKAPLISSSKSIQIISSQMSTENKGTLKKVKNAEWEEDINYYRVLVREIMSQYKRLDGFLKQSEKLENLREGTEGLIMSSEEEPVGILKKQLNIQEYRKKIMLEYQEVPIFEYKTKMQEIQEKLDGQSKRRNLLVVQPENGELDLDIKDYEPGMRTVLGSGLYFDKENITKRKTIIQNPKEKQLSLQKIIFCKPTRPENCRAMIYTPKSCLFFGPKVKNESNPEKKCPDFES